MAEKERAKVNGKMQTSGWNPMFQNPLIYGVKKHLYDLLQHRYPKNEAVIEKLAAQVLTEQQYEEIGNLIAAIYEAGYLKAVDDHKDQLEQMGFKANVVSQPKTSQQTKSLFPQEKSG